MKRRSLLHMILELIVVLGYLVLGVTVLTFTFQNVPYDRIFIGVLIAATGMLSLTDFFTWKFATRMRSLQTLIASVATIIFGFIVILINIDAKTMCILWGAFSIGYSLARTATATVNLVYQPLINSVRIILAVIEIIFSIILMIRTSNYLNSFIIFMGVALVVEAGVLFVEFMIHRYQRI